MKRYIKKDIKFCQDSFTNVYQCAMKGSNKLYLMYQLEQGYESDSEYTFIMLKKLFMIPNLLHILEQETVEKKKIYITNYIQDDLLQYQFRLPNSVIPLNESVKIIAKLLIIIEQLHFKKVIYRNILPQNIKIEKDQVFLFDFKNSIKLKHSQRLYELVGLPNYMAPQMFSVDGYGEQIDVWAAGILLFFLIMGECPFKLGKDSPQQLSKRIISQCQKGFNFKEFISNCKNPAQIVPNKQLSHLFERMLEVDPQKRIKINQLKRHQLLRGFFQSNNQINDMFDLDSIEECNSSLFVSQLSNFPYAYQFHKQEVILDLIQRSAQAVYLDSAQVIQENPRMKAQFAILKVGLWKLEYLLDVIYGRKKPTFQMEEKEWNRMSSSKQFAMVKQKLQKKQKILQSMYKSSLFYHKQQKNEFFQPAIPKKYSQIKIAYRTYLSKMFQLVKIELKKAEINKQNQKIRKLVECLVRLIIVHLINRIFEEDNIKDNFELYYSWSGKTTLDLLQDWIQKEKVKKLKDFMLKMAKKYL